VQAQPSERNAQEFARGAYAFAAIARDANNNIVDYLRRLFQCCDLSFGHK
jgi:hypothetical protein